MTATRALHSAAVGFIAGALALPASLQAQASCGLGAPFDHLKCYKVKASRIKGVTATLTPLQAQFAKEGGCKIVGPVELCVPVCKDTVQPPPTGQAPSGPQENDHLCYKLSCPKNPPQTLAVADQFGTFQLTVAKPIRLCTPAVLPSTTTVTTTTTITNTTRPVNECTTTTIPLCGTGPAPHECTLSAGCPGGQTCDTTSCSCVGPTPTCDNAGVFFCAVGTCPAGQTCRTACGTDGILRCQCF